MPWGLLGPTWEADACLRGPSGGRLAAPGRLQGEDWVDTRPQGRLQGGDLSFGHKHSQISVSRGATGTVRTGILRSFFWA